MPLENKMTFLYRKMIETRVFSCIMLLKKEDKEGSTANVRNWDKLMDFLFFIAPKSFSHFSRENTSCVPFERMIIFIKL